MTDLNSSFAVGSAYSWNGPVCTTCGQGYIGSHKCKVSVLKDKIAELQKVIDEIENAPPQAPPQIQPDPNCWKPQRSGNFDPSDCACSPSRGGSGICGCVLGSWTIT